MGLVKAPRQVWSQVFWRVSLPQSGGQLGVEEDKPGSQEAVPEDEPRQCQWAWSRDVSNRGLGAAVTADKGKVRAEDKRPLRGADQEAAEVRASENSWRMPKPCAHHRETQATRSFRQAGAEPPAQVRTECVGLASFPTVRQGCFMVKSVCLTWRTLSLRKYKPVI